MKASIIIPMYNAEETIQETIESALAQTHRDTEIIVVDDSSTDNSQKLALSYKPWVTVVAEIPNGGVARARNTGANLANGEVFLFLDADDLISITYLEETIPQLDLRAGAVATGMQRFGLQKEYISPRISTFVENNLPITSLIRRTAFLDVGGYDPSIMYEDWDFWLRIIKTRWQIRLYDIPLFYYRVRPGTRNEMQTKDAEKYRDQIRRRHG